MACKRKATDQITSDYVKVSRPAEDEAVSVPVATATAPSAASTASTAATAAARIRPIIPFKSQDAAIKGIVDAVLLCEDTFAVGGKSEVKSLKLHYLDREGAEGVLKVLDMASNKDCASSEAVHELFAAADESLNGYDVEIAKVRRDHHIPAGRIVAVDGFDVQNILPEVQSSLFSDEEEPIEAQVSTCLCVCCVSSQLQALMLGLACGGNAMLVLLPLLSFSHPFTQLLTLNIDPEKGEPSTYVCKPDCAHTLGYLEVTLPLRYDGGKVVVSRREQEKSFDFSSMALGFRSAVAYTAFLGDVVRVANPVVAGFRLTLSYKLISQAPVVVAPLPSANIDYDTRLQLYHGMPLAQLKKECKTRGLVSSGEHHDLVVRLTELPGTGTVDDVVARKAAIEYIPHQLALKRIQNLLCLLQSALESEEFFTNR